MHFNAVILHFIIFFQKFEYIFYDMNYEYHNTV